MRKRIDSQSKKESEKCITCKHWERIKNERMGECSCKKWVYEGSDLIDGVSYADYEGYSAGFKTGEFFGCIHYAVKGGINE